MPYCKLTSLFGECEELDAESKYNAFWRESYHQCEAAKSRWTRHVKSFIHLKEDQHACFLPTAFRGCKLIRMLLILPPTGSVPEQSRAALRAVISV